jgi:hypothetical protein
MPHEEYCRITHPQIAEGSCPACHQAFSWGGDHRWDLSRMEADADGGDPYTLQVTAWNLKQRPPKLAPAIPLYRKLLASVEEDATFALALQAADLADDEAASLEAAAYDCPDDLALRIALLGYHSQRQFKPASTMSRAPVTSSR